MSDKRVLIIAGTHERENEFSHSVADRLIQEYGAKEPDYTFLGVDKARAGKLWLYDEVAVAKIDKIGKTSREYLETLPIDCLTVLAYFKVDHEGLEFSPSIDSCFGNVNQQWTSVTQPMIDASDAGFYIDLHSYHAYSQLDGTGLYIIPHADVKNTERMKKCLDVAKREDPQRYGTSDRNPLGTQEELTQEIKDEISERLSKKSDRLFRDLRSALKQLNQSQIIDFLRTNKFGNTQIDESVLELSRVNSILFSYEAQAIPQLAKRWGDLWYFKDEPPSNPKVDRFTFEAVHWQGRQQEAVVNFIKKYLTPKQL